LPAGLAPTHWSRAEHAAPISAFGVRGGLCSPNCVPPFRVSVAGRELTDPGFSGYLPDSRPLGALTQTAVAKNPAQVSRNAGQELAQGPTCSDPRVHPAEAPVVSGNRIRPIPAASVELCQRGSSDRTILGQVKPITTADIQSRRFAHLHRALGPGRVRTPHIQIRSIARLCATHRGRDAIERKERRHPDIRVCMAADVFEPIGDGRDLAWTRALTCYRTGRDGLARYQTNDQRSHVLQSLNSRRRDTKILIKINRSKSLSIFI
jgi:hypothetical protein